MSASQLLRILRTLPMDADDDDQICDFNKGEVEAASMNKSSRCTNPFLQSDDHNNINDINFWNNPQLATSIFGNEFSKNHEDDETLKKKSTQVSTGFYINKHSVECELPELVVCYQDQSDFQVVNNICIHDDDDDDEKAAISILNNNNNNNNNNNLTEFLERKWLRPPTMTTAGCCMDVELSFSYKNATINHGPENLANTCEDKLSASKNRHDDDAFKEDWSLEEPLEFPILSSNINYANDVMNQHPLQDSEEELSKRTIVGSEAENPSINAQMTDISDESNMARSVAFHYNNPKSATSSDPSEAMHPDTVYEFPLETESVHIYQEEVGCSKLDVGNHEEMRNVGDSSFSMAGVISELISCSRSMPFAAAGISTRSNSSATSTRSFAFPTLETEYVSSPVKMGKSERRRSQKQRGWKKGLLCCKF